MHDLLKKPTHIGTVGSRSVLITFGAISNHVQTAHWFPPPERKPNTNENRNYSKMFGALRSPPPAANGNRSSSTAVW